MGVRTLRGKYGCGDDVISKITCRNCNSNLWLGVCKVWKHVADGVSWKIGDDRKAKFWNDFWFKKGVFLREVATMPLNDFESVKTVNKFVLPTGEWNMCQLKQFLLEKLCSEISNIHISGENVEDSVVWNHPKEINFTVKSAYRAVSMDDHLNTEHHWNLI